MNRPIWSDWIWGSKILDRKEVHIDEWKNKEDINQLLEGDDVRQCLYKHMYAYYNKNENFVIYPLSQFGIIPCKNNI